MLKTYMASRLLKARVQARWVTLESGKRLHMRCMGPLPFGKSEAMRYCASVMVSASSLYQSADCLM